MRVLYILDGFPKSHYTSTFATTTTLLHTHVLYLHTKDILRKTHREAFECATTNNVVLCSVPLECRADTERRRWPSWATPSTTMTMTTMTKTSTLWRRRRHASSEVFCYYYYSSYYEYAAISFAPAQHVHTCTFRHMYTIDTTYTNEHVQHDCILSTVEIMLWEHLLLIAWWSSPLQCRRYSHTGNQFERNTCQHLINKHTCIQ